MLTKNNVIDLIDVIVRRNYIKLTRSDICKNFCLNFFCFCCKKKSVFSDKRDI